MDFLSLAIVFHYGLARSLPVTWKPQTLFQSGQDLARIDYLPAKFPNSTPCKPPNPRVANGYPNY